MKISLLMRLIYWWRERRQGYGRIVLNDGTIITPGKNGLRITIHGGGGGGGNKLTENSNVRLPD